MAFCPVVATLANKFVFLLFLTPYYTKPVNLSGTVYSSFVRIVFSLRFVIRFVTGTYC